MSNTVMIIVMSSELGHGQTSVLSPLSLIIKTSAEQGDTF